MAFEKYIYKAIALSVLVTILVVTFTPKPQPGDNSQIQPNIMRLAIKAFVLSALVIFVFLYITDTDPISGGNKVDTKQSMMDNMIRGDPDF